MTLQNLRYLVEIANHQSFSSAAKALFVSQSALSAAAPEEIIREKTESAGLLPDRLILYARKFYPTKTLERTVDVILGGLEL